MKDPIQVLRQKEADLARVRKEVESLNTVAVLLEEDNYRPPDNGNRSSSRPTNKKPSTSASDTSSQSESKAAGSENMISPAEDSDSSFLNALKRAM